jgi:hypothetical protein
MSFTFLYILITAGFLICAVGIFFVSKEIKELKFTIVGQTSLMMEIIDRLKDKK